MNKKILLAIFFMGIISIPIVFGIANPAAVYCKDLGYEYEVITDEDGSQSGLCHIKENKTEIDCLEWDFYAKNCAREYAIIPERSSVSAREEKDRGVTETWLKDNGYKYHGLIMEKPRIKDEQEYVWVDNRPVSGVVYKDNWLEIDKQMN